MVIAARKYTVEIHDPDSDPINALVTILDNAHLIAYTEAINQAPTLSFDLPADDTKAVNIIKANEIWLRDYEGGTLVNRFRLTRKSDTRGEGLLTITVSGEGLVNQLADEYIPTYTTEVGGNTIEEIVTALLGFQIFPVASRITVGVIDPVVSRSIKVDGDTILRALYRLRDTVGDHIFVDENRALQWKTIIGQNVGQQIRYKKNLKGITRDIDYTTLTNRIYAYGAGEGDARIKLSDAEGHAEDYVEHGGSQLEWGGIYVKTIVDKSITHPDTLLEWAKLRLDDLKDPRITYQVDAVDLSASDEIDFSFEALKIGSTIWVIDEDLGISVSAQVVKIMHPDLLHPELMEIEIANRTKDITDVLGVVYDTQQLQDHIATQIGAGQVIVKGPFTVMNWVTDGETTIVGSNIETGTMAADRIIAGTIESQEIIIKGADGILRSDNYDPGVAGWQIEGDGDAEFNEVTIRGTVYATAGEFAGSVKVGETLAILGEVTAGAGAVVLNADGVTITGELLKLDDELGAVATLGSFLGIAYFGAVTGKSIIIVCQQHENWIAVKDDGEIELASANGEDITLTPSGIVNVAGDVHATEVFASTRLKIPVGANMFD